MRTEIYEYSKTLGNSQFVLLSFQPYKLIYAHMLAEVGRISDALKYCQAVIKSLKTGRTTEVETLRHLVLSLEERIKAHQQGGFSTNLAPKKLVGKLLNLFDTTAHRVVGSIPPAALVASGSAQANENYQSLGPRVSTSQSTLAMSSLVPSQSSEPVSDRTTNSNRMVMHTRSVSEPNFGRSPMQSHTDSLKEVSSTNVEDKASAAGGTFGFGSFGFGSQLLQKTVGLVLRPRQGRQAKLGESNKFYYDEKLKRWVEEGVEPPAEETTLPPPPPITVFQNGTSDYHLKSPLQSDVSHTNRSPELKSSKIVDNSSGIPPLPPTPNQYSTRGRIGVRSRYVDTFNKGGGNATNMFQSPSVPSIKLATEANPKFFVPTPVAIVDQPVDASAMTCTTHQLMKIIPPLH
ncbi:UNVERIFIED_CONTAM: protein transport protein SEC16B [Sesamum angustifolium]|uniref:Protein transport protein SEC16B n=1 Tax=Sesamum angustifolium TaxID=2727405 RepID=A0AAW2M571_9LAMI